MVQLFKKPADIAFSRNPILFRFKLQPYSDQDVELNTRLCVALYAESEHYGADFKELKLVTLRPDADGFCEIDFSVLLDAQLDFYTPAPGQLTPQRAAKQSIRYYLHYYVTTDYEAVVTPTDTQKFHVIKGGLSYPDMDAASFFTTKTSLGSDKTFLNFPYAGQRIHAQEPQWLYTIAPQAIYGLTLEITYNTYTTPGVFTTVSVNTTQTFRYGDIICIPCGIGALQLNLADADKIINARFHAYKGVINLGDTGYIPVSQMPIKEPRYLCYHNSIGGFDTLMVTGDHAITGNYTKQDASLINVQEFAVNGRIKSATVYTASREVMSFKGESGFINKLKLDRLRDLLNSNYAFEMTGERKLSPVRIRPASTVLMKHNDQLFSLALDWEEAWQDSNYTPQGYIPFTAAACPAVAFFSVAQKSGKKALIQWQLAEGYSMIEVDVDTPANAGATPSASATTFFLQGNAGSLEIDLSFLPYGPGFSNNYRFYARTVCDFYSTPKSVGPWYAIIDYNVSQYAIPIVRNDFANTYQGAGSRQLIFNPGNTSVFANDTPQNGSYGWRLQPVSLIGSAGGTIATNVNTGVIFYTPPSPTFTGVDVFSISVREKLSPGPSLYSAAVVSKIFVKVGAGAGQNIATNGMPYVKLVLQNFTNYYFNYNGGSIVNRVDADLVLKFYKDAQGLVPYDVSNLGLQASVNGFYSSSLGDLTPLLAL